MPEISVLFGYRNRDLDRVRRCLESFSRQTFQDFEIVFVDYGSEPDTREQTRELVNSFPAASYFYCHSQGREWNRAHALNIGVQQAQGRFILFSDIDIIFSPGVLAALMYQAKVLDHQHCEVFALPKGFSDWNGLNRQQPLHFRTFGTDGKGGVHFLEKKHLMEIGGYDEYYCFWGLEDKDLYDRLERKGLRHGWIDKDQTPVYHQWHPTSSYKSNYLMPEKWWDQMNIYLNLQRHTVQRNAAWGTLWSRSDRPVVTAMESSPQRCLAYAQIETAIAKCTMFDEVISALRESNRGDLLRIDVGKSNPVRPLNRVQRKAKALITLLARWAKLPGSWMSETEEKLANRQLYSIPFIDIRYLVWNLIRHSDLLRDYFIEESEHTTSYYLIRN